MLQRITLASPSPTVYALFQVQWIAACCVNLRTHWLLQVKPEFTQLGDLLLHMESSPLAIAHRTLFPSKSAEQVYLK